jgi:3-oxoadipate enol-lactonase
MRKQIQLKNGNQIAFQDVGNQDVIVLLHGFCGSSDYWNKVIPPLSESYRVIAVDLRGHGESSAPDEVYNMELFAEDVAQLAEELELPRFHLFGHSLGGYVTLAFVEKYADKLAGFGLIHSTAFPDTEAAKANRDKGAESISENGMEPFIKALVPKLFAPAHAASMPEEVQLAKGIGLATPPIGAIQTLKGMRNRPDRSRVLQETALPLLLVAGEGDQIIPADKTFVVDGPQVMQVLLKGAGHMGMLESPEELVASIRRFMLEK